MTLPNSFSEKRPVDVWGPHSEKWSSNCSAWQSCGRTSFPFFPVREVRISWGDTRATTAQGVPKGCVPKGLRGIIYSEVKKKKKRRQWIPHLAVPRRCSALMPLPDLVCLISFMPKISSNYPRKCFRQVVRAPTSLVSTYWRRMNSNAGGLDYIFLYFSSKQSLSLKLNGIFVSN